MPELSQVQSPGMEWLTSGLPRAKETQLDWLSLKKAPNRRVTHTKRRKFSSAEETVYSLGEWERFGPFETQAVFQKAVFSHSWRAHFARGQDYPIARRAVQTQTGRQYYISFSEHPNTTDIGASP